MYSPHVTSLWAGCGFLSDPFPQESMVSQCYPFRFVLEWILVLHTGVSLNGRSEGGITFKGHILKLFIIAGRMRPFYQVH